MFERYLLYLSLVAFIGVQGLRTAAIVGSNAYDARVSRQAHPRKRLRLSVVAVAHNDSDDIASWLDCLFEAIGRRRVDVVVVDNASTDDTLRQLRRYKKRHPRRQLIVKSKRTRETTKASYTFAARFTQGDILLLLTPQLYVTKEVIPSVLQEFSHGTAALLGLRLGRAAIFRPHFTSLLQMYELLALQQRDKLRSLLRVRDTDKFGESGTACHRQLLMSRSEHNYLSYAPGSLLIEQTIESPLTLVRLDLHPRSVGLLLADALPLTYFFYLAYTGTTATLFLISWATFIVWAGLLGMAAPHVRSSLKLLLVVAAPMVFFLWYILQLTRSVYGAGRIVVAVCNWIVTRNYPVIRVKTTG